MRVRVDHVKEFHFVDAVGVRITLTCNDMGSVKWDSSDSELEFLKRIDFAAFRLHS